MKINKTLFSNLQRKAALTLVVSLLSVPLWAQVIDPSTVLFGLEATFQDQSMVDEPGRMTTITPHKKQKFEQMIQTFLRLSKAEDAILLPINHTDYKPGVKIVLPGNETFIVDMEPVCIEWNQNPLKINEISQKWKTIYQAASLTNLVPYVNPAAERSGMGHIHIGGQKVSENPFFQNPLLLRNTMVYYHQHPSLLWGFAEAFDIGANSNIETYHDPERQNQFQKAVLHFDQWYATSSAEERIDGGFKFLELLKEYGGSTFFAHYRLINLQHVASLAGSSMKESGEKKGKYTVEFRNIRPYRTPEHAEAMAQLLLDVFTSLSRTEKLIPFKYISESEYDRFHSGLLTAEDWTQVKQELGLKDNKLWNQMLSEYTTNLSLKAVSNLKIKEMTIAPAYSEKDKKGKYFELVLPGYLPVPSVNLQGRQIDFQKAFVNGKHLWVAIAKIDGTTLKPEDIYSGNALNVTYGALDCRKVHSL